MAVRAGYADDTAVRLGHIRLKEGRFPTGDEEIALCADAIEKLGLEEKLDLKVLLWGKSFKVVGIVESYGALWPKGYEQSKSRFYPINAFLDIKSAEELFRQNQKIRRIILIVRTPYVSAQMSGNGNFYQNQNVKEQLGRNFMLPPVSTKFTYVVSVVLLLSVYTVFAEKDRHRQRIYRLLGMVRTERMEIVFGEYFILGLFGIVAGAAFIAVLTTVSAMQIGIGVIYKNIFKNKTLYRELVGNMPFDYDLELFAKGRPSVPGDENTVYLENSYEKDGVSEELAKEMEKEKTFETVKKYKENNKVKIILDSGQMDEYLDIHDGIIDNAYFPTRGLGRAQELLGYGDRLIVDTKLMGYSEEELAGFAGYVTEEKINIDKLISGEEVILMAPAFIPETLENGMRMKFSEPDAKGAVNNSLIKAGDQIRLTALRTEREINGAVTEDELKKDFKKVDKTVTVGAVIPYNIGWFEKTVTIGEPYFLMTAYKRLNRAVKTYTNLVILLIMINAYLCISAEAYSRVRMNMRKISLFRINGMWDFRSIRIIWIESAVVGLVGILISIPLMLWLQEKIFGMEEQCYLNISLYPVKKRIKVVFGT